MNIENLVDFEGQISEYILRESTLCFKTILIM